MWGLFSLLCSFPALIALRARKAHFWTCSHSNSSCHRWEKSSQILGELLKLIFETGCFETYWRFQFLCWRKRLERRKVSFTLGIWTHKNFSVLPCCVFHFFSCTTKGLWKWEFTQWMECSTEQCAGCPALVINKILPHRIICTIPSYFKFSLIIWDVWEHHFPPCVFSSAKSGTVLKNYGNAAWFPYYRTVIIK